MSMRSFYKQALRGLLHLYRSHPRPVDIEPKHLAKAIPAVGMVTIDLDEEDDTVGTLRWLRDNGLVQGSWMESTPLQGSYKLACASAQLTRSGLRLMEGPTNNLGGKSFGEFGAAITDEDSREWRILVDNFRDKLIG